MSSFYGYRGAGQTQFGILPLIMAAMPLIQGALTTQPLDTRDPYAANEALPKASPVAIIAGIAGIAALGGLAYFLVKKV